MRALPLPPKKLFLVDDVVTTSSAFLTEKEEVLLQDLTFFSSFFEKQRTCVHDPPGKASQPALIVFSHSGPTKKSARKKEMGGWVGGWVEWV
jgi:hypothetical protein